jgi:hypothetical protein
MTAPVMRDRVNPRIGVAPCSVEGCAGKYRARGLCSLHYSRWLKSGDVGPVGPLHKPGIAKSKTGYLYDRSKAVHRTVMEEHIGRALHSFETVHHRNGIRDDNRIENLELWMRGHPAGQRVQDIVAFVVEHYQDAVVAALNNQGGQPNG